MACDVSVVRAVALFTTTEDGDRSYGFQTANARARLQQELGGGSGGGS